MARGLNKAMIIGFVERGPEKRYTPQGQAVTSFSVSTSRRWTTNAGEARQSKEWFHVVAWGQLAENGGPCPLEAGSFWLSLGWRWPFTLPRGSLPSPTQRWPAQ